MTKRKLHLPPPGRSIRDEVIAEINDFLAETGMSQTRFGFNALNDGNFYMRFTEGGRVPSIATIDVVREYMQAYRQQVKAGGGPLVNAAA